MRGGGLYGLGFQISMWIGLCKHPVHLEHVMLWVRITKGAYNCMGLYGCLGLRISTD